MRVCVCAAACRGGVRGWAWQAGVAGEDHHAETARAQPAEPGGGRAHPQTAVRGHHAGRAAEQGGGAAMQQASLRFTAQPFIQGQHMGIPPH